MHHTVPGNANWGIAASTAAMLGLLLVVASVYWAGLTGGYVFDDFHNIVNNPYLSRGGTDFKDWVVAAFSAEAGPFQRPLAMLTFAANVAATGLDPRPMKLTNLGIHLVNTLLVYAVCRQLFGVRIVAAGKPPNFARWASIAAASLWALHPINLMAVLYVVQRMESLCHLFVFGGLWIYLVGRHRQLNGRSGWLAVVTGIVGCTTLGALAKESAVLLPLYAAATEVFLLHFRVGSPTDTSPDRRLLVFYLVVLVIPAVAAVALLLPAMLAPGAYAIREFTMTERLLTEARVIVDYAYWTFVPNLNQLSIYHDDYAISRSMLSPPTTLLSLLLIAACSGLAWRFRRGRPLTALGLAWFLSAHLLTGTFIPLELVYEHRNYFASLGLVLIAVDLLLVAPRSDRGLRLGGVAIFVCGLILASLTWMRANEWNHPLRFAITEAAKHPLSPRATYELARNLVGLSNYDVNSPYTRDAWAALERAREAPGSNILPDHAALILAARTGVPQERVWWEDMQQKLRTQPMGAANQSGLIALNNCAVEQLCRFSPDDMLATFAAALHDKPEAGVLSIYGKYALHVLHDRALALELWEEAVRIGANNPQFHANLAMLLIDLGEFERAQEEIRILRNLSKLGVFDATAVQLEERMASAKRAHGNRKPVIGEPTSAIAR